MKQNILSFVVVLATMSFVGCEEAAEVNDPTADSNEYSLLIDYSATDYPTDTDTWIITDTSAETTHFAGLSAAIYAVANSGREISLEFPNLIAIPNYAIFGTNASSSTYLSDAIISITADVATSVGSYAFSYCDNLSIIDMPLVTTIGQYAFVSCPTLTTINMPSAVSLEEYAFSYCTALKNVFFASSYYA